MSLHLNPYNEDEEYELQDEAQRLFDNIFKLKVFPAGRTLWIGGTEAVKKYPMANFNCSFRVVDDLDAFTEVFYLLMLGCGTGFRILPTDVDKLPKLNNRLILSHEQYRYNPDKSDESFGVEIGNKARIIVGDSKEGWVEALKLLFEYFQNPKINILSINYDYVRPAGSILKTFGGRASGPEGLKTMFENIWQVITYSSGKLRPIDALDIMNNIAYNVVVGGVRRSSQIALFDINDTDVLNAKVDLYTPGSPNYGKFWRAMSNNSIFFTKKPTPEQLEDIFTRIQHNGEPGFVNSVAAESRRQNFNGINPCAEILLDNKGVCNLTEVNLSAFIDDGVLNRYDLELAIRQAVRMGLRQTNVTLELPEWDKVQKRDRLTGVSLTGVQDAFDKLAYSGDEIVDLLQDLGDAANYYAKQYAREMRIPEPLLVTTIKPSGTISQLPTVSSGAHRSFAPYFIRRMRITSSDPIAKVVQSLNYPIYPETGQGPNELEFDSLSWDNKNNILKKANTWVAEFPVHTNTSYPASQETALFQYKKYLNFQKNWTDHNTSISIYFKKEEVPELINYILQTWNDYIAVSFLPTDTNTYNLMPYEQIDDTEYSKRLKDIISMDVIELLNSIEKSELLDVELDPSCATGICPVR
jgi:ribonucleoside-diphosphate reductase alpha chain/ribonucleoside-triphosphate reductase